MNMQLIDEFRRRTHSSYDEARYYLERYNGDLLEAIIAFEKDRSGKGYAGGHNHYRGRCNGTFNRLIRGFLRVLQKLIDVKVVITDSNERTFRVPLLVPLVLFPVWYALIIVAIILYCMGFKISFQDMPDPNLNLNSVMDNIRNKMNDNGTGL